MSKTTKTKRVLSAVELLRERYVKGDARREKYIEEELERLDIAEQIYNLRHEAGLTQSALAKLVGTSTSVISRLEDCDYEGHSMAMLRRVAEALNARIQIKFVKKKV